MTFIAYQMIKSQVKRPDQSDVNKYFVDYIAYTEETLEWYSFNFVLIIMPPILIYTVYAYNKLNDTSGENESFSCTGIMYTLWAMHVFQFIFNNTLYEGKVQNYESMSEVLGRQTDTEKTQS